MATPNLIEIELWVGQLLFFTTKVIVKPIEMSPLEPISLSGAHPAHHH
jgi:hypothetical protein